MSTWIRDKKYVLWTSIKLQKDSNKIILYIVKTHLSDDIVIINDNLFWNYIKCKVFEEDKELLNYLENIGFNMIY